MSAGPAAGTIIVTGGASGIGLAIVETLLNAGWRVAAFDRDAKALAAMKMALSEHGRALHSATLDVTDEAATGAAVAEIARMHGPLRGLVTSAGVGSNTAFFDTTPELMRRMNEVNVVGSFAIAKAVAEEMRASGGGAIVLVASVSGLLGNHGRTAYGASKGAVVGLTRIMAVELASAGIRVNAIAPGPVETAMTQQMHSEKEKAEWLSRIPLRRYGSPQEMAEAVLFLIDPARSSFITGQVLAVDGGFSIGGLIDT